jgi:hypothetical protein
MTFYDRAVTPAGKAMWAHLVEPDEYEGKEKYKINFLLPEDKAQDLMDTLTELANDAKEVLVDNNKKVKPAKKKSCGLKLPFEEHYDEEGNPTGDIEFKFSCNPTDSKGRDQQPPMFDTKPSKLPEPIFIGNGSIVKVSYQPRGYYNAAADAAGITLHLRGVQIIELVAGQDDPSEDFDSEDGDFQVDDNDNMDNTADASDF